MRTAYRFCLFLLMCLSITIFFKAPDGVGQDYSPYIVEKVQRILAQKGYKPGKIDGVWGGKTEAAVRAFQKDHRLTVTGRLDERTKKVLAVKGVAAEIDEIFKSNSPDTKRAFKLLNEAANKGETTAHLYLGLIYIEQKKYKKAAGWLKKAAEKNNPEAQYRLALLYSSGLGVPADRKTSCRFLKGAGKGGHKEARKLLKLYGCEKFEEIYPIPCSADVNKVKSRFISAGMTPEKAQDIIDSLNLDGRFVHWQNDALYVSDNDNFKTGDYEVAGRIPSKEADTFLGHYIAEYRQHRLRRLDLSDGRTFYFEKNAPFAYRAVQWDEPGVRKYTAYYTKRNALKRSILNLLEFGVNVEFDETGKMTQKSLSKVLSGSPQYSVAEIKGLGFELTHKKTGRKEMYAYTGNRIFTPKTADNAKLLEGRSFDEKKLKPITISAIEAGKKTTIPGGIVTKHHVAVWQRIDGKRIRQTIRSNVLGDDALVTLEKGVLAPGSGKINWAVLSKTIPTITKWCDLTFIAPVKPGEVELPVGVFFNEDYADRNWISKKPEALFDPEYQNILLKISSKRIKEADEAACRMAILKASPRFKCYLKHAFTTNGTSPPQTLLCIKEKRKRVGKYTMGQPAHRYDWEVRVFSVSNRRVIAEEIFYGATPPRSIRVGQSEGYGGPNKYEFGKWIATLLASQGTENLPCRNLRLGVTDDTPFDADKFRAMFLVNRLELGAKEKPIPSDYNKPERIREEVLQKILESNDSEKPTP